MSEKTEQVIEACAQADRKYSADMPPHVKERMRVEINAPVTLRSALEEARVFVARHVEPWYYNGQILLARIDRALDETPKETNE